jgi:hypothetical protein
VKQRISDDQLLAIVERGLTPEEEGALESGIDPDVYLDLRDARAQLARYEDLVTAVKALRRTLVANGHQVILDVYNALDALESVKHE